MMLTTKIQNKIIVLVNSSVPLKLSLSPSDATYHQNSIKEIDKIDEENHGHQQPKTNEKLNKNPIIHLNDRFVIKYVDTLITFS